MNGTSVSPRLSKYRSVWRELVLVALALMALLLIMSHLPSSGRAASDAAGPQASQGSSLAMAPVSLSFSPGTKNGYLGYTFWIDVVVNTGGQPVDAVQAYVNYDTNFLDALQIVGGTSLSEPILSQIDDGAGHVNYAAGVDIGTGQVSGTFMLCRIEFRATALTGGTQLSFNTSAPRISKAGYEGSSYPSTVGTGTVVITQPATPANTPTITPTPSATLICLRDGENGYDGIADTYMSGESRDTNYGTSANINVKSQFHKSGLIRFDLSDIPPEAVIVMAAMDIRTTSFSLGTDPMTIGLYAMKVDWSEFQADWYGPTNSETWDEPIARGSGDRDSIPVRTFVANATDRWYNVVLTSIVQQWVDGTRPNYGLLMEGSGVGLEYRFWSSDWRQLGVTPRLCVEYTRPTPTPTPTETATNTPEPPTLTPTATLTETTTPTLTMEPTATETPTQTPTGSPGLMIFLPLIMR